MCEGQRKRVMEKCFFMQFFYYRLYTTMSGERKISSKLIGSSFNYSFSNTNVIFFSTLYTFQITISIDWSVQFDID